MSVKILDREVIRSKERSIWEGNSLQGRGRKNKFPFGVPLGKGLKLIWRANKEGGQTVGNREYVVPVTKEIFEKDVLRLTKKRYYRGRTVEEMYTDFKQREPNTYASYVDAGRGWKLTRIGKFDEISLDIADKKKMGWTKVVDDVDSDDAIAFRKSGDSNSLTKVFTLKEI